MFITRATRRDHDDIKELLARHGWDGDDLREASEVLAQATTFIARQGPVIGCVSAVEVEPQTVVLDNVLVHEDHRNEGIGRQLIQAALNTRGGTMYLCCHEERLRFYGHLGFEPLGIEDCPPAVVGYWKKVDDYPTPPGHIHYYLRGC